MTGWRDTDGRTAAERKALQREYERARFAETVKRRPLSLVKPLLGAAFVALLVIALLVAYR